MNVANVASTLFISVHMHSGFTVVTDDCHANSIFVRHVTKDSEGFEASLAIRVDDVRTIWNFWTVIFYFAARFPYIWPQEIQIKAYQLIHVSAAAKSNVEWSEPSSPYINNI